MQGYLLTILDNIKTEETKVNRFVDIGNSVR